MFQQDEQQQYYEPYRQNRSFGDNGNNNRTDSATRNNNTNDNTLQHSNKDNMGMLTLLTTGMDNIKKEINAIKVRLIISREKIHRQEHLIKLNLVM